MKTQTNQFWQVADKTSVDDFIELLNIHTLDPAFLNYGKYASMVKKSHFHPKHQPETDQPRINSKFTDLSWHFSGNPTQSDILRVKKAVNKHIKTERFQSALRERFNCVSIELTYFLAEGIEIGFSNDWYGTIKSDLIFPLDNWFSSDFRAEWKRMQKVGESLKNITFFEIKPVFKEIHYTSQEFEELVKIEFPKKKTSERTIIYQARRVDFSKDKQLKCKKFTFKSTGRSILYDSDSMYCFAYQNIDPFITKVSKY